MFESVQEYLVENQVAASAIYGSLPIVLLYLASCIKNFIVSRKGKGLSPVTEAILSTNNFLVSRYVENTWLFHKNGGVISVNFTDNDAMLFNGYTTEFLPRKERNLIAKHLRTLKDTHVANALNTVLRAQCTTR